MCHMHVLKDDFGFSEMSRGGIDSSKSYSRLDRKEQNDCFHLQIIGWKNQFSGHQSCPFGWSTWVD